MQSVILDTNVLVSALIQKSFPHYIVFDFVLTILTNAPKAKKYQIDYTTDN